MALLNPVMLASLLLALVSLTYSSVSAALFRISLLLFIFGLFLLPLFANAFKRLFFTFSKRNKLSSIYWRLIGLCVIFSILIEYVYFGLPVLGQVLYVDFGLPLMHHFVVFSWILLFIDFKVSFFNAFSRVLFFANPMLILNRDLLLLSFFIFFFATIRGRGKIAFILLIMIASLFVGLGMLRSPYAIDAVSLPINIDIKLNPAVFWLVTYVTSSTFNMGYGFDSKSVHLYSELINVFPEYYFFYINLGYVGVLLFFSVIASLFLILVRSNYFHISLFSVFMLYNFYMGVVFSSKVFITHTLFCVIVFFLYFIFINRPVKTSSAGASAASTAATM